MFLPPLPAMFTFPSESLIVKLFPTDEAFAAAPLSQSPRELSTLLSAIVCSPAFNQNLI
jgi:hypothetical protein